MKNIHKDLMSIYQAGLSAVKGRVVVNNAFNKEFFSGANFHVVAIGKAADSMLQGVPEDRILSALLISKYDHISAQSKQTANIQWFESDHPIPKKASLNAGKELVHFLEKLPEKEPCLFLISGGASSLVEVVESGWNLSELVDLTNYLLASGYPINEINAIRRRVSKIKGGGLWAYIGDRKVSCLMISDVPNDDPADIGSGLLFQTEQQLSLPKLPKRWGDKISLATKKHSNEPFDWEIIASLDIAKQAARKCAQTLGYDVKVITDFLEGDTSTAADNCIKMLKSSPNCLFIFGGETTVKLPEDSGKGGRNQHLALAASISMQGEQEMYLLAAGTDGTDGMTDATGAFVDHQTINKGVSLGLEANDYLGRADSYNYFNKIDGLIFTGATGTNVMDLLIGFAEV